MNMNIRNNANFFAPVSKSESSVPGTTQAVSAPMRIDELFFKVRSSSSEIVGTLSQAVQRSGSPVYTTKLASAQELVKGIDKVINNFEGLGREDEAKAEAEMTRRGAPAA